MDHLKDHQKRMHAAGDQFDHQCNTCEKSFRSEYELKKHIEMVHEKVRILCEICNKAVVNVKSHISNVHEGEKNFKCEICDKMNSSKSNLQLHIDNVHKARIENYCCQFCQKNYSSQTNLKNHIRYVHENVEIFKCKYCNKEFIQKGSYKKDTLKNIMKQYMAKGIAYVVSVIEHSRSH